MHEGVQAAMRADDLHTWAQHEMKRVAEHDLCAEPGELLRRHRLDRAICTDRHERRRLHHAALEGQPAAAGASIGAEQFEPHGEASNESCNPAAGVGSTNMASP